MKLFTTIETAKILNYTNDAYIRRLIKEGKIKAIKKGKTWLISDKDIKTYYDKYLNKN